MTCEHSFKGMPGALCPLCPTDAPVEPLTDADIEAAIERGRREILAQRERLDR